MKKVKQFIRNWIIPNKSIILFCTILMVIVWSGILWQINQDKKTTLELVMRDGDRMTRAFEEHVRRVLKVNEQYLTLLKDNYENANGVTQSTQHLIDLMAKDQLVVQIGVLGTDGHLIASFLPDPNRADYFQSTRFQAHMSDDTPRFFLDRPSIGPVSGRWSIPLSVRLSKPDGSFNGVAYVSSDPDYFNKFYWDMNFNEEHVIRIVGRDGYVRVSSKNNEIGAKMVQASLWKQLEEKLSGFYRSDGSFYGKPLLVSYRAMSDYPIIVQVGVAESVLAPMNQRAQFYLGVAAAVSIFIIVFGGRIIASSRRKRQAEECLTQNEERLRAFVTNTPIIFYAINSKGTFILSEGLGLKKIGLEPGQAEGYSAMEMYRDNPDIMAAIRRSLDGEAVFFEHQVGNVYLDNRMVPVFDECGKVKTIIGAALDITERVLAEKNLKTSYEELAAAHEELIATEEEVRTSYNELINERAFSNAVLESVPGLLYLYDMQSRLIRWNKNHETATGYSSEELAQMTMADWYKDDEETCKRIYGEVAKAFQDGTAVAEADLHNKNGDKKTYYFTAVKTIINNQPYIVGIGIDITEQKRAQAGLVEKEKELEQSLEELTASHEDLVATEEELRKLYSEVVSSNQKLEQSHQAFADIFNAAADGLVVFDGENGDILAVNRRMTDMFGYTAEELKQQGFVLNNFWTKAVEGAPLLSEREIFDRSGQRLIIEISSSMVMLDGKTCCLALLRDVTTRKQMEENMEFLRNKDPMTGVYNRGYFETDIMRLQSNELQGVGMFVCDVDGLKLINDTLGHRHGDELLKKVAEILNSGVQQPEYVARIGGDEFAVVLVETTKLRMEELEQLYRTRVNNYNNENPHLPLSLSLGWAFEKNQVNMEVIFKTADNNMYRQKMHQSLSVRGSIVQIMMKALEEKDHITEGHTDRVGKLMEIMGYRLNLPQSALADLRLFAKFHDIGKVGVSDNILKKPGKLTDDEMAVMRQHCEIGFRIAKSSPDLEPIADWILKHQEHWDGGGYPLEISGNCIPIQCRILSIVDAFDAMTNDRPYRKALPISEALAELRRCAGKQFDPQLVDVFLSIMEEHNTLL